MRRLILPTMAAVALFTGCSAAEEGPVDIASAGGEASAGPDAPELDREEMAAKFVECMRENGIDMPDPEPGGGIQLRVGPETPPEKLEAAQEACREYSPQQNGNGGGNPEMAAAVQAFAECMRANGVEDFPDPEPGQGGIRINGDMQQDPDFAGAQEKCQELLAKARGQG